MRLFIKSMSLISLVFLMVGCSSTGKSSLPDARPSWLDQRPVDQVYYYGIGSASKTLDGAEAQKSAQDLALADIASQISVNISSEIVTKMIEKGAITEDEYLATARSRAVAELEGHELVDMWEDASSHYAFYRLSKAQYASIQARKRTEALSRASDFYEKSKAADSEGDFSQELKSLLLAFQPLIPYLNEALKADVDGKQVILANEINTSLFSALSGLRLEPNKQELDAKLGKPIRDELEIVVKSPDGTPVKQVPLTVFFANNAQTDTLGITTNDQGVAAIPILRLSSGDKLQVVRIEVNPTDLIPEQTDPILLGLVNSVTNVSTQVTINVSNPTIFLASSEIFNGQQLSQKRIEPQLKNHLIEAGFHFVDFGSKADWYMEMNATATPGTQYSGMYTVFADVSLSLRDRESGKEIYKNSLSRVKGIDLNYPAAANKALSNAAKELTKQMMPQILASLK